MFSSVDPNILTSISMVAIDEIAGELKLLIRAALAIS